ncbi:Ribonuclease H [Abeliophyllum distichum]|uniref:Ribonuclease H n=1 Tax=Abeliophyllum distichum TaxID=126358 RepID=A0ABD1RBA4_9LAMI
MRVAKKPMLESYWVRRESQSKGPSISFSNEDEVNLHYSHCDALVIQVVIACNIFKRMLVDNKISVNVLFENAFNQMEIDHLWTPMFESLYVFTGNNIIHRGKITLVVEVEKEPLVVRNYIEFLIISIMEF